MTLKTLIHQQQIATGALTAGPVPGPEPLTGLWVDCSNYTGPLSDAQCQDLKAAGYMGAIVQCITGNDGKTYTRQQCEALVRNGLRVAGYAWCFRGFDISTRLHMFEGFQLAFLALDVEAIDLHKADVDRDLALCDAYPTDYPTSLFYTGKWYFDAMGWSHLALWADHPLWDSDYDGNPVVGANFRPYGGWTSCIIKQFHGTSDVGGVHEIDLNAAA